MLAALLAAVPAAATSDECDPDFVTHDDGRWWVSPTGSDDTANIICALNEAAAYTNGAGGDHDAEPVVRLEAGDFYSDFLFVEGFTGKLRGESYAETSLMPLEGGLDCKGFVDEVGVDPIWMVFVDSTLVVTDMSIDIPDQACDEPYFEDVTFDSGLNDFVGFRAQDFSAMVFVTNRVPFGSDECGLEDNGGLKVKRVKVDVPPPDFSTPVFHPIGTFNAFGIEGARPEGCDVWDTIHGDVVLKNNHIHGPGNFVAVLSVKDSVIRIKHNKISESDTTVILVNNPGSYARVAKNTMESTLGLGVVSDNCLFGFNAVTEEEVISCLEDPFKLRVRRNAISTASDAFTGVLVADGLFAPPMQDAKVVGNDIHVDGALAGVLVDFGYGVRVRNNDITGASVFGVLVEEQTTMSKFNKNDFRDHLAFEFSILLGEQTSGNMVNNNKGATVLDLGTGNTVNTNGVLRENTARATALEHLKAATARGSVGGWTYSVLR